MPTPPISDAENARRRAAVEQCISEGFAPYRAGSGRSAVSEAARRLGIPRGTMNYWADGQEWGSVEAPPMPSVEAPKKPRLTFTRVLSSSCYLVTSAQNNTEIHEAFWENLQAYAAVRDAEILVGGFVYNKDAQGQRGQEKKAKDDAETGEEWDHRIDPFRCDRRMALFPGLQWCGEMNTIPTAVNPLSGLESYTKEDSGIFPHPKVALVSVATPFGHEPKLLYTTGAVTKSNYIQRKAGLKAEFDHVIGALIVESDGEHWYVRQINANEDGSFQDLDVKVVDGRVSFGHPVEGIIWFDVHVRKLTAATFEACWGKGGVIDALRPRNQFFNDLHDHESRNHHETRNPRRNYYKHLNHLDDVAAEIREDVAFIKGAHRQWCNSYVVQSNHDNALQRWLDEADPKADPRNAEFFYEGNLECVRSIKAGRPFNALRWALEREGIPPTGFISENDSHLLAGKIEVSQHGHIGPNGAKGSPAAFAKLGRKMAVNHFHSAGIIGGVYVNGASELDMGYNAGFSSWSRSFTVAYETSKRTIITMRGTRWRA